MLEEKCYAENALHKYLLRKILGYENIGILEILSTFRYYNNSYLPVNIKNMGTSEFFVWN